MIVYAENIARLACAVLSLTPLLLRTTHFAMTPIRDSAHICAAQTSNGCATTVRFKIISDAGFTRIVRWQVAREPETAVSA